MAVGSWRVFVALGSPDQVYEPTPTTDQRGRSQIWDYREHRLQIVFTYQSGFGRWKMTSARNRIRVRVRRVLAQ